MLRRAMKGILPDLIRMRRDKAEFSCVIDGELKKNQTQKIENLIQTSILSDLGFIHKRNLEKWFRGL